MGPALLFLAFCSSVSLRSLIEPLLDCAKLLEDKLLVVPPPRRVLSRERVMRSLPAQNAITGPRMGRQADTIPADISMAVQPTVGARV